MKLLFNAILCLLLSSTLTCLASSQTGSVPPPAQPVSGATAASEMAAAPTPPNPSSREYHLKAAFLRYVAKYIEWPKDDIKDGTINICILGQVPAFEGLNSINGKIVNDLTLVIRKILTVDDNANCQIVFVTKTEDDDIPVIVKKLVKKPILTFGDMPGFAEKGGAMNFYIANNRLAIMVNLPPIGEANLKVNPQMLRLVTIVPS